MERIETILDQLSAGERSNISLSKSLFNSGYVGMLQPLDFIKVLPGDSFDFKGNYDIQLARCKGIVRNNLMAEIHYIFVPWELVWKDFYTYLWTDTGSGANLPVREFNLDNNTSDAYTPFYMLPQTAWIGDDCLQNVDMRYMRAVQKVWYDHFAETYIKLTGLSDPSLYYSTASGTDSTTSTLLRGTPINNSYIDKLIASIENAGNITSPFNLQTLQAMMIKERTLQIKKKYGTRPRDLISKMFKVPNVNSETSRVIATHRFMLNEMQVLNTSNTDTGTSVSRFLGVNNNNDVKANFGNEFGVICVLGVVRPIDTCVTTNVSLYLDADFNNDAYGEFRPEAQGLALKQLKGKHLDALPDTSDAPIAAENIYDHLRYQLNEAKGHFSRAAYNEKEMVSLHGSVLLNFAYYDTTHFTDLFASNPQITFALRYSGGVNRAIKNTINLTAL